MTSGQHKLFFGIFPDRSTRSGIAAAAQDLRGHGLRGRWVNPRRYHLTVLFLGGFGAVPSGFVGRAAAAGARVQAAPFELELDTFGSFRNRDVPVWIGCRTVPPALEALHRQLMEELQQEEIPARDTKPLVPHVTLLRGTEPFAAMPAPTVHWSVRELHLIDSRLAPQAEYVSLGRWPLANTAC